MGILENNILKVNSIAGANFRKFIISFGRWILLNFIATEQYYTKHGQRAIGNGVEMDVGILNDIVTNQNKFRRDGVTINIS